MIDRSTVKALLSFIVLSQSLHFAPPFPSFTSLWLSKAVDSPLLFCILVRGRQKEKKRKLLLYFFIDCLRFTSFVLVSYPVAASFFLFTNSFDYFLFVPFLVGFIKIVNVTCYIRFFFVFSFYYYIVDVYTSYFFPFYHDKLNRNGLFRQSKRKTIK